MGERKGVNKYYPPDYDPSKGSLNSWQGSHPLRDRARKLHKGILVIRFEMPYNIWCGGCNNHIGMGVRYNAEKSKVGSYYTTPIYKFRMKCHLCNNYFEIQTDPKNHDYVILEGARRKEQRWDPKENEQIVPEDKLTQKKMATDPMYKLEHGSDDKDRGKVTQLSVAQIEDMRESWNDDYMLNKLARSKFRGEKKEIAAAKAADKALLDKSSLDIELVPETEEDHKLASLLKYTVTKSFDDKQKEKRKAIANRPLFSKPTESCAIAPKPGCSFSRRAQIKHKLGLHLTSARVDHAMPPSTSIKGLVKDIRKTGKRSSSTENSDTSPSGGNSSASSSNSCEAAERTSSSSTENSSSSPEVSQTGDHQRPVDREDVDSSSVAVAENSASPSSELPTIEDSLKPVSCENSADKVTFASERAVSSDGGLSDSSFSANSENIMAHEGRENGGVFSEPASMDEGRQGELENVAEDEKTGLAALMASYSDSDSNSSDST